MSETAECGWLTADWRPGRWPWYAIPSGTGSCGRVKSVCFEFCCGDHEFAIKIRQCESEKPIGMHSLLKRLQDYLDLGSKVCIIEASKSLGMESCLLGPRQGNDRSIMRHHSWKKAQPSWKPEYGHAGNRPSDSDSNRHMERAKLF